MPKYRFACDICQTSVERYTSISTEVLPCKHCSSPMKRLLPNIGGKKVTEIVDHFCNVHQEEDHKKHLQERTSQHFWGVEVPRMVASGVYSLETCLEEGWLIYNEKHELVVGTGPLQKK